jgi:hypothetical protein
MRTLLSSIVVALGIAGCQDPIMQIDQSVDCHDVCERYRSCYDTSYDTGACQNRCENYVHGDGGHGSAADACDMCMDDTSCASAAFTCSSACANILP